VIPERERAHVKEILDKGMMGDVTLANFTQEFECDYCREHSSACGEDLS